MDRTGCTLILATLLLGGCAPAQDRNTPPSTKDDARSAASALAREMLRMRARADTIDAIFQPMPLLRPAQEAALRRFGNDTQLAAARRLGVAPNTSEAELEQLVRAGRLVRLADSSEHWVVRRLDHSAPYVTPDAAALLRELAQRFHGALAEAGVPPYRLEVTSALRSAEDQARLRALNPNAAQGLSTHQYGTTFDVAYNAFAPPAAPIVQPEVAEADWLEPHLVEVAAALAETVAARRSRELMAVLGTLLIDLQNEGRVMVTLERLQPVYHMTVARRAN
jgi:hypothetical protein